jgi:hypothetical protein
MPEVTLEVVAAILTRVEADLKGVKEQLDRLDIAVRGDYVQRAELSRFVTLERYIWTERIVMAGAALALVAFFTMVGSIIWNLR